MLQSLNLVLPDLPLRCEVEYLLVAVGSLLVSALVVELVDIMRKQSQEEKEADEQSAEQNDSNEKKAKLDRYA